MITKFLKLAFVLCLASCSGYANKTNFGLVQSNVGDLSFQNINNIKEYESCTEGSIGLGRAFLALYTLGISEISLSRYAEEFRNQEYEIYKSVLLNNQGDSSISSAVKLGGISKIKMIDHSYSVTGLMSRRYCVIAYGE